jgi:BirA family biotin operon repressor/biotin-[acetyl-CoA-carboxylase] ligase
VTSRIRPNLIDDYHLLAYDELDSTNEEARRLAEGGGSHGAVIWARKQTKGRGRMGRQWVSQEGNLFCSVLLAPGCPLEVAGQLSFVAAVAAAETLQPIVGDEVSIRCKWPNDILLEGKKLGGILLESFEVNKERWVVVGVGINIDSCPEETDYPATFLKDAGVEIVSAKIVLSRFIHHFIQAYDLWSRRGFAPIRRSWLKFAHDKGEALRVRLPDATLDGQFDGLDPNGNLQLKTPQGRKIIHAGDVFTMAKTKNQA